MKITEKQKLYKKLGVPSPEDIEAFNDYLRENNEVLEETEDWILIKNRYIDNQLVLFSKRVAELHELGGFELGEMADILKKYKHGMWYRNAVEDRSIPDRLHLHIKL